jgi:hypothetical protein
MADIQRAIFIDEANQGTDECRVAVATQRAEIAAEPSDGGGGVALMAHNAALVNFNPNTRQTPVTIIDARSATVEALSEAQAWPRHYRRPAMVSCLPSDGHGRRPSCGIPQPTPPPVLAGAHGSPIRSNKSLRRCAALC